MSASKAIHTAFRELGIKDEIDQRALYTRVTGQSRLTLMSSQQQEKVIEELRRLGFKPAKATSRKPSETLSGKYASAIRAFWLSGYNLGVFAEKDDRAILAFAKRQTWLEHVRFVVDDRDGAKIIEAIKAIVRRETGDRYALFGKPVSKLHTYMNDAGVQVLHAQWQILGAANAAPGPNIDAWWAGADHAIRNVDRKTLVAMQIALGKLVRKAKGAK